MKCDYCKADNPEREMFCQNCGNPLKRVSGKEREEFPVDIRLALPNGNEILLSEGGKESEFERVFGRDDFKEAAGENHNYISREHFKISKDGKKIFIEDNSSRNGTKLNGEEVRGKGRKELKKGDEIMVADVLKLKFDYDTKVIELGGD
jgi:hypothetical protein